MSLDKDVLGVLDEMAKKNQCSRAFSYINSLKDKDESLRHEYLKVFCDYSSFYQREDKIRKGELK